MSAKRFWAQGRGKNRENIDKKEKGWKNTMFDVGRRMKKHEGIQRIQKTPYLCRTNALIILAGRSLFNTIIYNCITISIET